MEEGKRRNKWSTQEDEVIFAHVKAHGAKDWGKLAETLQATLGGGRTAKSCRLRWYNELTPTINRAPFSDEEMAFIASAVSEYGTAWSRISVAMAAAGMKGRTDNAIKNCYHVRLKRNLQDKGIEPGVKQPYSSACITTTSTGPSSVPGVPYFPGTTAAHASGSSSNLAQSTPNIGMGFNHDILAFMDLPHVSTSAEGTTQNYDQCNASAPTSFNCLQITTDEHHSNCTGSGSPLGSPKRGLEQRVRIVKRPSRLHPTLSQPSPDSGDSASEEGDPSVARAKSWATQESATQSTDVNVVAGMCTDRQILHVKRPGKGRAPVTRGKSVPNLLGNISVGNQASWLLQSAPDDINADFLANLDESLLTMDPAAFQAPALLFDGNNLQRPPNAATMEAMCRVQQDVGKVWSPFDVSVASLKRTGAAVTSACNPALPAQMVQASFAVGTTKGDESPSGRRRMTQSHSTGARRSSLIMCSTDRTAQASNSSETSTPNSNTRVRFADILGDEAHCSAQTASIDSHPAAHHPAALWPVSAPNALSCDPSLSCTPVALAPVCSNFAYTLDAQMAPFFPPSDQRQVAPVQPQLSGTERGPAAPALQWPCVKMEQHSLTQPVWNGNISRTNNSQAAGASQPLQNNVEADHLLMLLNDSMFCGDSSCPGPTPHIPASSIHDNVDIQDSNENLDAALNELQSLLGGFFDT